jgi:hypothetical protein
MKIAKFEDFHVDGGWDSYDTKLSCPGRSAAPLGGALQTRDRSNLRVWSPRRRGDGV